MILMTCERCKSEVDENTTVVSTMGQRCWICEDCRQKEFDTKDKIMRSGLTESRFEAVDAVVKTLNGNVDGLSVGDQLHALKTACRDLQAVFGLDIVNP